MLAENGYNVGFGAKKHFASYDIIVKLPFWISFIVLSVGIIQVAYPNILFNKEISIGLIVVGIASLSINFYTDNKDAYDKTGVRLTQLFNKLRDLYLTVKHSDRVEFTEEKEKMDAIMSSFYDTAISKQVFMSQWYAHIKFFYEMQIDWIDEQLKFGFLKDKVPGTIKTILAIIILFIIVYTTIKLKNEYFTDFPRFSFKS